jgi:pre-mRNA cleavage complex 2 protein Pcf11
MDAYTLVDPHVRRKFEELLVTWKQPPPTGISPMPVFPQDVTRKIETALLRAKTLALQLEQRRQREAAELLQHQGAPLMPFPQQQSEWSGNLVSAHNYPVSRAYSLQNIVSAYPPSVPSVPPLVQPGPSNQDILLAEIRNLLSVVSQTLFLNPADEAARTQAAALDQLQKILQMSVLPYDQVEAVRQQLAALPIAQQQRPPQTSTPPIGDIFPPAQDRNTESLLDSLRAAGLLGVSGSSASSIPQIPAVQPLIVNANVANLRNSDLELTSASLQK